MITLDAMIAAINKRDTVLCPHCSASIDMTDSDRTMHHVSYWGDEDGPKLADCWTCGKDFYLKEHVTRHWTASKTEDEDDE